MNRIHCFSSGVIDIGVQEEKFSLLDLKVDPSALWSMDDQWQLKYCCSQKATLVCNWQFRDDTWIQVTHPELHYFIISQTTHVLTIFFPELWFRKYQKDHTASLLLTEITQTTQIKFGFKPHYGTKSGGLTTYKQLHMRVSISWLKPQWAEVSQIALPLYSGLRGWFPHWWSMVMPCTVCAKNS